MGLSGNVPARRRLADSTTPYMQNGSDVVWGTWQACTAPVTYMLLQSGYYDFTVGGGGVAPQAPACVVYLSLCCI